MRGLLYQFLVRFTTLVSSIALALTLLGGEWVLGRAFLLIVGSGAMANMAGTIIDFMFTLLAVVIAIGGVLRVVKWEIQDTWRSLR